MTSSDAIRPGELHHVETLAARHAQAAEDMRERARALAVGLIEYAHHKSYCNSQRGNGGWPACDCGLDTTMATARAILGGGAS